MSNDDISGIAGTSAGFDRSHFHRNLSSFNTPEVSRFIRKCHGKDETTQSSRRCKLSIPHSFPRYSSKIEKSHSPTVVGSSDTEAPTRNQRFFAVICTSYRSFCWPRVVLQNYQVERKRRAPR